MMRVILQAIPPHLRRRRLVLGLSGGVDSSVLLHILASLHDAGELGPIHAVHVHHGLHPEAEQWAAQAEASCQALGVPFFIERVTPDPRGAGLEAAAREARYQALAARMGEGGVLLTAHHRDDQAETFLLQLMRGAGVRGLSCMPRIAPFALGWHLRPMLEIGREAIHAYALEHGLHWVEDPSNANPRHARNLIRHGVMPLLHTHWPEAEATLARAARRMALTEGLLGELGRIDLHPARCERPDALQAEALSGLPDQRLYNALRTWLGEQGAPMPPEPRLAEIRRMLEARPDAQPSLGWGGWEIRRWRQRLYLLQAKVRTYDKSFARTWDAKAVLECPELGLRLIPHPVKGRGLRLASIPAEGLGLRAHHPRLKKRFQAAAIPPWERQATLLIFIREELAQIGAAWIAPSFAAQGEEPGVQIELQGL